MKNKKAILIISLVVVILSAIIFINSDNVLAPFAVYPFFNQSNENFNDFKIGVFAVCEEKEEYIYCEDNIFASCNNELIHVQSNTVYCKGKEYKIPEMDLISRKFPQNWEDQRPKNLLTSWATGGLDY